MRSIVTNYDPANINVPCLFENDDATVIRHLDASGTTFMNAARLAVSDCTETIVVCKHIDASNYAVYLYPQPSLAGAANAENLQIGITVEIYAEGGNITVFQDAGGTAFLDGATSVVISTGAKFRYIVNATGGLIWARLY